MQQNGLLVVSSSAQQRCPLNAGYFTAVVHSIEVVRLIWGPLNTGFTVLTNNFFHFSRTRTSDEEDTEFGDCTVMIEDEVITASQQVQIGLTGH